MSKQPDEKPEVLSITDVPESHTDEMHRRMVKYTLAMGIRLACLLLFFFIDAWFRWFFVAGAVFLPWIAVIIANGGSDKTHLTHSTALLDQAPLPELEAPSTSANGGKTEDGDFLTGVVIDDVGQHPAHGPASPAPGPGTSADPATDASRAADESQASADAAGPAPSQPQPSPAEQEDYDQSAAFMGSLSPVVKRRRRKTAA